MMVVVVVGVVVVVVVVVEQCFKFMSILHNIIDNIIKGNLGK
jgi:hypothetical protein